MAGKGDRDRTSDREAYRDGWERVFGGWDWERGYPEDMAEWVSPASCGHEIDDLAILSSTPAARCERCGLLLKAGAI